MKIILKRLFNTLTVFITVFLIYGIFNGGGSLALGIGGLFYALVLACNYILLGSVTLWHKSEDI